MNEFILKDYVRPVREEDRGKLPVFSYSKIDTYRNCPFQYDLKYNQGKYTNDTSIALELGSLLHYVLEMKGKKVSNSLPVNYEELNNILYNGVTETDEKTKEKLLGINDLKKKYWEVWSVPDSEGRTYEQKLELFDKVLHSEMDNDTKWEPYLFEHPFEFVWNDRAIIKGFIDRIDIYNDEYKVLDYKTNKKVFDKTKLATSLQFGIYALALLNEFNKLPVQSVYRFILLDDKQEALTKGWEKRLIKAMDGIFDKIEENNNDEIWIPKSSPLCYWCNYCKNNPDAKEHKNECEYFSLWTPDNKCFAVNKEFVEVNLKQDANSTKLKNDVENKSRRLVF